MYALNLSEDNRILSACVCLEGFEYENIVDELPNGNITDYKYIDGRYVHDPLPKVEDSESEPQPTTEEVLNALLGVE